MKEDPAAETQGTRVGQTLKGKWKLTTLLGVGGMGEVYAATHRNGSRVAIKILHASIASNPGIKARFLQEGYLANAVDHPRVVRVVDDDTTLDGMPFLVMELLEGEPLDSHVHKRGGHLSIDETLALGDSLLDVLVAAHGKKILHRDLKPENVFLTNEGNLKVLDFGLAKVWTGAPMPARQTVAGRLMGTPGYMSPEQACGNWNKVDETTDLWALAATLHFCLTGHAVHDHEDPHRTVQLTITTPAPPVQLLAPALHADVAALIDKGLSFERRERWQSALEMQLALRAVRTKIQMASAEPSATPSTKPAERPPSNPQARVESPRPSAVRAAEPRRPTPPTPVGPMIQGGSALTSRLSAPGTGPLTSPRPAGPTPISPATPARAVTPPPAPVAPTSRIPTPSRVGNSLVDGRSEALSAVEFAPDTYWVGKREPGAIFHSNPYLRVFKNAQNPSQRFPMLIDPGSTSDLAVVLSKVSSVLGSPSQLAGLFVNHQDPDVGSSASVLCARYATQARVLCSEATWRLIIHFGLPRDRFIDTEKYPQGFRLPTGQVALPVPSPFCHFRGAVMLYDPETRVLFSGDLFGGLTAEGAQGLWADESDWSGMRAFHQMYMPSNRAIAPVVRRIRQLDPPVEIIAPQHGRILQGDVMHAFLDRMLTLPVGMDLLEEEQSPDVLAAWNSVLHRVLSTAESFLGPDVRQHLLEHPALRDVLTVERGRISAGSMGRWAVSAAVNELTVGQPSTIANPIKIEAMLAAEEFNLPSPDLHIEDAEGSEVQISIE